MVDETDPAFCCCGEKRCCCGGVLLTTLGFSTAAGVTVFGVSTSEVCLWTTGACCCCCGATWAALSNRFCTPKSDTNRDLMEIRLQNGLKKCQKSKNRKKKNALLLFQPEGLV